jgi:tetratricopeptide (TPR) repeat protein
MSILSTARPSVVRADHTPKGPKAPLRVRQWNVPLLAGTLIAGVILAPLGYVWRGYQVRRTSDAFVERAAAHEAQNDWRTAATYLHRYLQLNPDDAAAWIRLAEAFDRSGSDGRRKARAIELHYVALGIIAAPEQPEEIRAQEQKLRHRLVELLLETQRFPSAESEAAKLLKADPVDAEGLRLLAMACYGQLRSGALVGSRQGEERLGSTLLQAVARNPGNIELSMALAQVLRDESKLVVYQEDAEAFSTGKSQLADGEKKLPLRAEARIQLADAVVDRMVAANPASPKGYLARHQYSVRYRRAGAADDLKQALERGPKELNVLLTAAGHARREKGSISEAPETLYRRAMEVAPADEKAYIGLGDLYAGQAKLDQAIATWRQGLEKANRDSVDLNLRLADALITRGRLDEVAEDSNSLNEGTEEKRSSSRPLDTLRRVRSELVPRLPQANRLALERAVDLVEGRWLVAKGLHAQAIPFLQRVRATEGVTPAETSQISAAHTLLGTAYMALAQEDQAALAYQAAATLQPSSVGMQLQAAAAWMAARQTDQAIRSYEQALKIEEDVATRLLLAQARFQQQASLPENERNWQPFQAALDEIKRQSGQLAEPWRVKLLEASYLMAAQSGSSRPAGSTAKPLEVLRQAESEFPASGPLMAALTLAYQRFGQPEDVDRALKKFQEIAAKDIRAKEVAAKDIAAKEIAAIRTRVCLLHATLLRQRSQHDEARKVLNAGLQSLPPATHSALRGTLVQVELAAGNHQQAETVLRSLHEAEPSSPVWVVRLADLAWQANDLAKVERWERVLRDLEGPDGTHWKYYRGRRLLLETAAERKGVDDPRFVEADQLRVELLSQRPSWAPTHLLAAAIYELRGRPAEAVEAYGNAVRLGASEVGVYERIIALLYGLRRFDTADEYLSQLKSHGLASTDQLLNWESHIAAGQATLATDPAEQRSQLERALVSAERRCREQPKDPLAWIWLGQLRLASSLAGDAKAAGKTTQDAEKAFREAVRLAPNDVRTHNGLFSFYMRTAQRDRALETLQGLANNGTIPPVQRALALGAGYEILGDLARAEAQYREADKFEPDNVQVKQRLAALLIRTDRTEAEKVLRALHKVAPNSGSARLNLAQVLASRALAATGPEEENLWQEVEGLLGQGRAEQSRSALDRRLYATLLYRRGGRENLQKSRDILKELVENSQTGTDFDRLVLARICSDQAKRARAEGDTAEAEKAFQVAQREYLQLVRRDPPNAVHLLAYVAFLLENGRKSEITDWHKRLETAVQGNRQHAATYVDLLLRHDLHKEAKGTLEQLAKQAPDSPTVVALRARWLRSTGAAVQIEPMISALAQKLLKDASGDAKREAAACSTIGNLHALVDQHEQAKRWYQRAVQLVPENYPSLALSLARQGQVGEAIRICLAAAKSEQSHRPALAMAAVLVGAKPAAEHYKLAEPVLTEALKKHRDRPDVLIAIANVRVVQGRLDEATGLYRQALGLRPKDVMLLNNLATLLAEQSSTLSDALTMIDRAIEIAGPQPYLMDTKGTILVYGDRAKEAVTWLQTAAASPSPDPRFHFHLAIAQDRCGKTRDARNVLQVALDGNLTGQILTERERKLLADLEARLLKKDP